MPLLVWFLWALFRGTPGGPVHRATWSELGVNSVTPKQDGAPRPPSSHLPMFLHAPGPLVSRELFLPVPHKSPFPAGLTPLLLPFTGEQQSVRGTGARAVQVWCGADKTAVRLDRLQLRAWATPSQFRLGSCAASSVGPLFLYFHYRLTECGGESKVVGGQLVYTHVLHYTPPPQGYIIRVLPLNLPIHCHYNRFHYSYHVGFKPQVQHTTFMKSIRSKLSYSLTISNAQGQPVPPDHWFYLGEPVHFVAQAGVLLAGERLSVDSCYATSSKDPNIMPKVDIIANYGCMTDSRRRGSSSRFLSGGGSVVTFSVDAFLFRAVAQVLYLHCSMSIGLTTSLTSKSCNYNKAAGRWEELEDTAPVCSCCDSMCTDVQDSTKNTVSSPGWLIGQRGEHQPRMAVASFQAEGEREWVDEDKTRDTIKDERHKEVQTLLRDTEVGHEEDNNEAIPEKNVEETKLKASAAVSQQKMDEKEEGETEEAVMEKELGTDGIMSYQMRPEEAMEDVHSTRNGFVSSLSSVSSNTNASKDGSGTTMATISSSLSIEYNAGSAENFSRAINPNIKRCPKRDQMSCSVTFNSAGRGAMYTAIGAESFTPNNVSATSGTSWDSRVNGSLGGNGPETLAGTPADTWNFEPIGFLNVSKLGESRLKSKTLDTFLWSEESVSKSVGNKLQGQAVDSVISKGLHGGGGGGGDDILQIRRLELSQSAVHPADFTDSHFTDWLLAMSDFDSGIEDEASGSVGSEEMHEDRSSHSAVVAVSDVLQGSESSQMFDRAEGELGWGLHTETEADG